MRTAVRLVSAPPLEPPFDDERRPDDWAMPSAVGAQLALQWRRSKAGASSTGTAPRAMTAGTLTRSASGVPARATAGALDQLAAGTSPAAWHASLLFLSRCQEILNGYRPASQVRPLAAPAYAQTIVEELTAVAQRTAGLPGTARPVGRRGGQRGPVARQRAHVCEPRPGVAEAMAVLTQEDRSWAVAFRLERQGTVWLCTNFTDVTQRRADLAAQR